MTDSITPPVGGHTPDRAMPEGASLRDRAVVNGAASGSAVPASVPSAMTLDEVFENLDAHAEAEEDFATGWILLAVDRHGEAYVLDADEGFWRFDLLTELWACDNQIEFPKGLEAGLYLMTEIVITPDEAGDPTFKGQIKPLATVAQAMSAGTAETQDAAQGEARQRGPQDAPEQGSKATGVHPHE